MSHTATPTFPPDGGHAHGGHAHDHDHGHGGHGEGSGGLTDGGGQHSGEHKHDHEGLGRKTLDGEEIPKIPPIKQTGWLVSRYYTSCSANSPAGENIVENVEAVGNCKYAGWMPTAKNGEMTHVHMMTYYDKKTTRLWQYFFAGEGSDQCKEGTIDRKPNSQWNVYVYNVSGICSPVHAGPGVCCMVYGVMRKTKVSFQSQTSIKRSHVCLLRLA